MTYPGIDLCSEDLKSKFGFHDGDILYDYCDQHDLDDLWKNVVVKDVLCLLVEQHLLPKLPGVRTYRISSIHNPIRAEDDCNVPTNVVAHVTHEQIVDAIEEVRRTSGVDTSRTPLVEAIAKTIYEQWVAAPGYVPWVEGGNSLNQDDARQLARRALENAGFDALGVRVDAERHRELFERLVSSHLTDHLTRTPVDGRYIGRAASNLWQEFCAALNAGVAPTFDQFGHIQKPERGTPYSDGVDLPDGAKR